MRKTYDAEKLREALERLTFCEDCALGRPSDFCNFVYCTREDCGKSKTDFCSCGEPKEE